MNSHFKKFLLINKKIIDSNSNEIKVVVADRSRFQDCLINASLGSVFCKKHKTDALVISDKKNEVYKQIYRSFGYNNFFEGLKIESFFSFTFVKIIFFSVIVFIYDLIRIYLKGYEWFIKDYKCVEAE